MRTEFHVGAKRDFQESMNWYREQSIEAAVRFATAVDDAVNRIANDPERFPQYDGKIQVNLPGLYSRSISFTPHGAASQELQNRRISNRCRDQWSRSNLKVQWAIRRFG